MLHGHGRRLVQFGSVLNESRRHHHPDLHNKCAKDGEFQETELSHGERADSAKNASRQDQGDEKCRAKRPKLRNAAQEICEERDT